MKNRLFTAVLILLSAIAVFAQDAPKPQQGDKPAGERPRGEGMRSGEGMRVRGTGGTITAIDGQTIIIKTINGGSATIKLSDTTRYMKDRQDAKLKDFKVGDTVLVRGEEAGENTWTAQLVVNGAGMMGGQGGGGMAVMAEGLGKLFIVGEVKKIDELKLTILRPDGQTQVIEVDENTSFRKQGESVTLADIKVGDQVMGRGEVKNGVFIPKTLGVGNFQQVRMGTGNNNPPNPK